MFIRSVAAVCLLLVASLPGAQAHHSFTEFDREIELVTTVTVVRWEFNNPHSWLRTRAANSDGTTTLWSFEGSGPTSLIQRGIIASTFEPGDTLTLMYCPMKDGRNGGHMGWVRLADGRFVNPSDGGCNGNDANIERWQAWLEQGFSSNTEALAAE
jgi:hypothetical protein